MEDTDARSHSTKSDATYIALGRDETSSFDGLEKVADTDAGACALDEARPSYEGLEKAMDSDSHAAYAALGMESFRTRSLRRLLASLGRDSLRP